MQTQRLSFRNASKHPKIKSLEFFSLDNDLYTNFKIFKLEEMNEMKLLSLIFKLVHTPDEFPEALKVLLTQHFQVHGYNTRNKNYLRRTHYHKKSYECRKNFIWSKTTLKFIATKSQK